MKQSRLMSLVEAVTNVIVGYGLAVVTQIIVFPWFGLEAALGEHMAIGVAFVAVSLVRSYLLRRLFERIRVAIDSGGRGEHGEPVPHRR
jgi:hypothetical protein